MFGLHLCLCTTCMPGGQGGQTFRVTGRYEACQDLNLGSLNHRTISPDPNLILLYLK